MLFIYKLIIYSVSFKVLKLHKILNFPPFAPSFLKLPLGGDSPPFLKLWSTIIYCNYSYFKNTYTHLPQLIFIPQSLYFLTEFHWNVLTHRNIVVFVKERVLFVFNNFKWDLVAIFSYFIINFVEVLCFFDLKKLGSKKSKDELRKFFVIQDSFID